VAPAEVELIDEPVALYRLYGARGELLYVGITKDLPVRFSQHACDKVWWPQVVRKTAVLYGSRGDALKAEKAAIRAEFPVHNKTGHAVPRQGKYRLPPVLRKPAPRQPARALPVPALPLGPNRFDLDPVFLSMVDSFARERRVSRSDAVGQLILDGLLKAYQLNKATMDDLDRELADMASFREANAAAAQR
jgi:predicted GIY-YIG superfamily endonuclease